MIEILCTGSVFGSACADERVPALVVRDHALLARRRSRRLRRSGPGHHAVDRLLELRQADQLRGRGAPRAARPRSSRLARSAPVKPGRAPRDDVEVDARRRAACRARAPRGSPCAPRGRDGRRRSGGRSARAAAARGRGCRGGSSTRAGSRPCFWSKPSISTSSWLSVCSRSSWPPPRPAPRWRPTASISSTNTIAGAAAFACSNRSRTRDAPTPTNISTKSEPLIEKNGTPASPATALREQRLAGAGRAEEQHALRDLGAHVAGTSPATRGTP